MDKTCVRNIHGQRIYGPPPELNHVSPPKGSEIFIGKLPRTIYEEEIFQLFSEVGTIFELRLMLDFSKSNRGYSFITYVDSFCAQRAIQTLDGYEIRPGQRIGVAKSVNNSRLFIRGIPMELSLEEIFKEFSKHTRDIAEVYIYHQFKDNCKNRGYAVIEYESHKAAASARRELIPGKGRPWNTALEIDWAQANIPLNASTRKKSVFANREMAIKTYMKGVNLSVFENHEMAIKTYMKGLNLDDVLFARNLPEDISEAYVTKLFSFDRIFFIMEVKMFFKCAFVHYWKLADARMALNQTNGMVVHDKVIEVMWAKDFEKLQDRSDTAGNEFSLQLGSGKVNSLTAKKRSSDLMASPKPTSTHSSDAYDLYAKGSYKKLLSAICRKRGFREPVFQQLSVLSRRPSDLSETCCCRLKMSSWVTFGTGSTVPESENNAAYIMLKDHQWFKIDNSKSSDSTLFPASSAIGDVVSGMADLSLNNNDENIQGAYGSTEDSSSFYSATPSATPAVSKAGIGAPGSTMDNFSVFSNDTCSSSKKSRSDSTTDNISLFSNDKCSSSKKGGYSSFGDYYSLFKTEAFVTSSGPFSISESGESDVVHSAKDKNTSSCYRYSNPPDCVQQSSATATPSLSSMPVGPQAAISRFANSPFPSNRNGNDVNRLSWNHSILPSTAPVITNPIVSEFRLTEPRDSFHMPSGSMHSQYDGASADARSPFAYSRPVNGDNSNHTYFATADNRARYNQPNPRPYCPPVPYTIETYGPGNANGAPNARNQVFNLNPQFRPETLNRSRSFHSRSNEGPGKGKF